MKSFYKLNKNTIWLLPFLVIAIYKPVFKQLIYQYLLLNSFELESLKHIKSLLVSSLNVPSNSKLNPNVHSSPKLRLSYD